MDNLYSSQKLFIDALNVASTSTLCCNRKGVPKEIVAVDLHKGHLLISKINDHKLFYIMSSVIDSALVMTPQWLKVHQEFIICYAIVHAYNMFMGSVHKTDQMLAYQTNYLGTQKW